MWKICMATQLWAISRELAPQDIRDEVLDVLDNANKET